MLVTSCYLGYRGSRHGGRARHRLRRGPARRAAERARGPRRRDARRARPAARRRRRCPAVEVASFVDPRRVPQMAGAEEVVAAVGPCHGVVRAGLALNERGYDRLLATGLDEVRFAFGVTESFNQRNQGAAVEDSIAAARRIAARARGDGAPLHRDAERRLRLPVRGRGRPRPRRRDRGAGRRGRAGRDRPRRHDRRRDARRGARARRRASPSSGVAGGRPLPQHAQHRLRERARRARGRGDACSTPRSAASAAARSRRDATGNIATEDLVYLLEREGVETGIDLDRLIDVARWLAELLGRRLEGQLYRAGRFPPSATSERAAGRIVPRTSASSSSPARPRRTTSSPSSRNVRVEPSASPIGCSPFQRQLDQRSLAAGLGPGDRARGEEVARRGSTRRSRWRGRAAAASSSRGRARSCARRPCRRARPRARRRAPSRPRRARYGSGSGSCAGAATKRSSSSASGVTQAPIEVANDFPRNGPERLVLPRLDVARAPVVDEHDAEDVVAERRGRRRARPSVLPTPTTKPSSSSMSSRRLGPKRGRLVRGRLRLAARAHDRRAADDDGARRGRGSRPEGGASSAASGSASGRKRRPRFVACSSDE